MMFRFVAFVFRYLLLDGLFLPYDTLVLLTETSTV